MLEIRRRFEGPNGVPGKPLLYTVFTVPPELRAQAADPKTWTEWRRAIWKVMKLQHGGLFAVERTDPAGDRSPEKWHPHLNFLWAQRGAFRPYLDTDKLQDAWAEIIGATRRPSIKHQFATADQPARRQHWYWYMGRTWPDWHQSVKKHLAVRWLGKFPKKSPLPSNCPDCGEDFLFVTGLDEKGADELAALGPAAVRQEWERLRAARRARLRDSIGPPLPRGRTEALLCG